MLKDELENTAFMARIHINEDEKDKYLKDINYMIECINILQEPDVSLLKPTTHVTELRNVWREDVVRPSSEELLEQMLKSAPEREGSFYKIKKVIEA